LNGGCRSCRLSINVNSCQMPLLCSRCVP
jgi:hypothetical protein